MKTKFELLDEAIEQFGLTQQEAIAHLSKKIEMPTIIPPKKFVTPSRIEAGMFHYSEENLIFPEIISELVIDSVVGSWDKNSGIGLCRDQKELPWSSDYLRVDNEKVKSGFEATQMILDAAEKTGKKAEAAQFCAKYAKYGIKEGQAFMFSKYEAEDILPNIFKVDAAFALLKAEALAKYLWSSSGYSGSYSWVLFTSGGALQGGLDYGGKGSNDYVCPAIALSI